MPIRQLTSPETYAEMKKDAASALIDVRTHEEFVEGHPAGAKNIPIFMRDPRTGEKIPNPHFDEQVSESVPKEAAVYLTCRTGQRSLMAAFRLEALGYSRLVNVKGGFVGSETTPGWKDAGLPVDGVKEK